MPNGKPNILILWGDDIGQSNLSCYSHGLMGYQTPNIDRVAKEGAKFIHYYAEQSCTAGRAAFISGQSVYRTGLSKVGLPGAEQGFKDEDPTIAELLKPQGYRTGQFGKNHFGDRDEHLPTMHGFDEFFGNLYHLNAEEEPELRDYPKEDDPEFPNFRKRFAPRGVLHCWANGDGSQRIESTGALSRKRMETADDEFMAEAKRFIRDAVASGEPFFVWFNTTHMHFRTYARPQDVGRSGRWQSEYHDVMIYHDECIGEMLDLLDELGVTDDTIVMYGTDNGPHMNSWPDAGMTPFRSEKNTNWEGAFRVPALVRWPGHIPAGTNITGICSHLDWLPTLLAAAGEPEIKQKLLTGYQVGNKTFRIHLDGYNMLDYWTRQGRQEPPHRSSSTSPTTATWWACATTTGSLCSRSSASREPARSGPSPSSSCGCPRSSTCSPIPTSGPTSPPIPTGIGCLITSSSWFRPRPMWASSSKPLWSSHRARRRPASPWSG